MYKVALSDAADTGGGVLSLLNPEGVDLIVDFAALNITTVTDAACTLDMGVGSGATTKYDNLIDGVDANAAIDLFTNHDATTGENPVIWTAGHYLTVSTATGAAAGLAGYAYIRYRQV